MRRFMSPLILGVQKACSGPTRMRDYKKDGGMVWTSYWPNGVKKSESHWQGSWAQGLTLDRNPDGKVIRKINFKDGRNLFAASNLGDD